MQFQRVLGMISKRKTTRHMSELWYSEKKEKRKKTKKARQMTS